jgi:hypothetical protein
MGAVAAGIDPRRRLRLSPRATHASHASPREKGRPHQQPPWQPLPIEPQQHDGGEHRSTHGTPPPPTIQIGDRHPDARGPPRRHHRRTKQSQEPKARAAPPPPPAPCRVDRPSSPNTTAGARSGHAKPDLASTRTTAAAALLAAPGVPDAAEGTRTRPRGPSARRHHTRSGARAHSRRPEAPATELPAQPRRPPSPKKEPGAAAPASANRRERRAVQGRAPHRPDPRRPGPLEGGARRSRPWPHEGGAPPPPTTTRA